MGAEDVVEPTFISLPKPLKAVLVAHFGALGKWEGFGDGRI
jgi:hypothetical protein